MPTNKLPRVYWDSCVFIDRIQGTKDRIGVLERLTDDASDGKLIILTSELSVAEVNKLKLSQDPAIVQSTRILEFFENQWIEWAQVDRFITEHAHAICRDYGLKPYDAVHVASAIRLKADVMMTYDGKKKFGPLKLNGKINGLKIVEPYLMDPQLYLPEGEAPDDREDEDNRDAISGVSEDGQGAAGGAEGSDGKAAEAAPKARKKVKN